MEGTENQGGAGAAQQAGIAGTQPQQKRGRGRPKGSKTSKHRTGANAKPANRGRTSGASRGSKHRDAVNTGAGAAIAPVPGQTANAPGFTSSISAVGSELLARGTNFIFSAAAWNPSTETWNSYQARVTRLFSQALDGHYQYLQSSLQALTPQTVS